MFFSEHVFLFFDLLSSVISVSLDLSQAHTFQMEEFLEWLEGNGITSTTSAILVEEHSNERTFFWRTIILMHCPSV